MILTHEDISFRDINLTDRPFFLQILERLQPETSDLNFTNLFIWRNFYHLKAHLAEKTQAIILLAAPSGWSPFYLPPLFDWTDRSKFYEIIQKMRSYASSQGFNFQIRRAPVFFAKQMELIFPGEFQVIPDRKSYDYLYSAKDLRELSGRKLHAKRNHLNRFLRTYHWEYREITPDLIPECKTVAKKWCEIKNCEKVGILSHEQNAITTLLDNFEPLKVRGGAILVDGKVEAFTVGEELNKQTAVIHVEKANIAINGIYAAINQMFAEKQLSEYEYINREEDLNLAGLRKAKKSYHPCRLVEKYIITGKE